MSSKMGLRRFALAAVGGYRGRDAAERFARGLIDCFGEPPGGDDGPLFGHSFAVVADGKRTQRTVSAYWPARRVVLDVVDRDITLDLAWGELLRACLQMDAEPQYVVLTNQRDVRLYDLARDRSAPRLTIALDELPKYSEAFPFFAADWVPGATPRIINVDKVSKEVADLVAKVYRALARENADRADDVIRFTLQCIVAMFSEDIGLLPKEYFTTLLYRAAEEGGAEAKLTELFTWMSTPVEDRGADSAAIPYFNGGLFTD
ncbi:MAG: type IIL restriction-modification enzyme MmeI, partial [Sandaracinaceae bacterium]